MKEKNPDYVASHRAYGKRIATRCRICGGQLLIPEEIKKEVHLACESNVDDKLFMMWYYDRNRNKNIKGWWQPKKRRS